MRGDFSVMDAGADCLARRLGSVAQRFRAPKVGSSWPPRAPAGRAWWHLRPSPAQSDAPRGGGPTARTPALARLEAVLFVAQEPLATRKLALLASLADGTEARTLLRKLNRLYDEEGCAFRAVEVAGGFQLRSRPNFAPWLRRFHGWADEVRLSGPAMETLAVVAYRQPVLRVEVEAVRGVQCGEILRQLMERDLVRIVGRSEELGRPFLYGTTKRFLEVFGLRHLEELPRAELARGTPSASKQRSATRAERPTTEAAASDPHADSPTSNEGESKVKTSAVPPIVPNDVLSEEAATGALEGEPRASLDNDDEAYEEDDDEDDDEDNDWEEVEDDDWEEVEDDEEEDWEEDEDDWDDDDEDDGD